MRRNAAKIVTDGRAVNWLGVNFWSRTGGPLMWRHYDGQTVLGELRVQSSDTFQSGASGLALNAADRAGGDAEAPRSGGRIIRTCI